MFDSVDYLCSVSAVRAHTSCVATARVFCERIIISVFFVLTMASWTIYINNGTPYASNRDFLKSQTSVGTVATYEALKFTWEKRVRTAFKGNFRVFREDVSPCWEHPAHAGGGSMLTNIRTARKSAYTEFLAVMRGLMDICVHDYVLGVVVCYRPWGYSMSLWLRAGVSIPARARLAENVQALTGDRSLTFQYMSHRQLEELNRGKSKERQIRQATFECHRPQLRLDPDSGCFVERSSTPIEKSMMYSMPETTQPPAPIEKKPWEVRKSAKWAEFCLALGATCVSAYLYVQQISVEF